MKRLETEPDFEKLKSHIRSQIDAVMENPELGREYLYKTGMYERDGKLKEEFVR